MQDIIQLLPDHISNQIAASEVIQQPASAIKEMVENAIDAKATKIVIILKDAGRTLIQVNDNGIGMSRTDARMCFEKHATSKIRHFDDLFRLSTNGFRGEALASIAAIAHIELKTKRAIDEVGTSIVIADSKVISQEPVSMQEGTQILMKNLFYNVPARRNFLKTDQVEMKTNLAEFSKLAIVNPSIDFTLFHNNVELYRLLPSNQQQRIIEVLGKKTQGTLVPIMEESDIIKVSGYVCKPTAAHSRTRSQQYIFVNRRFVKNPYIQSAIFGAYREMIAIGDYPYYVVFIDIDPKLIDINVHPAKTEVKFEDEQLVFGFVQAAVRRSLTQFNLAPSLDFNTDRHFNDLDAVANPGAIRKQNILIENSSSVPNGRTGLSFTRQNEQNWQTIFAQSLRSESQTGELAGMQATPVEMFNNEEVSQEIVCSGKPIQILSKYILVPSNIGLLVLDQRRAHERILYDELIKLSLKSAIPSQRLLFPIAVEFSIQDSFIVEELLNDLNHLGFDISPMGNQAFAIQGIPSDLSTGGERELLIDLVENFKNNFKAKQSKKETILISICKVSSIKKNQLLNESEIQFIADNIFHRENYYTTPSNKPIFYSINYQDIERHFN
jgi:DNA mismatch repair protein MutL